ncbi:MAG: CPBP family glutamic-type intramembrane protease [Acidobacteriota bacterium]
MKQQMQILLHRSEREAVFLVGTTWLAFVAALCMALPQPPQLLYVLCGAVVGAVMTLAGFAAASRARSVPRHSPRQRVALAVLAAVAGVALGVTLLTALVFLSRHESALHARFAGRLSEPLWRPWALGFESAILEEVTFRLSAMSIVAWLMARMLDNPRRAFNIALAASALLFGLAHLPAWLAVTHASAALVAGVLLLNGLGGIVFGLAFWRAGLPYAMVCHFFADLVVQGFAPRLLA